MTGRLQATHERLRAAGLWEAFGGSGVDVAGPYVRLDLADLLPARALMTDLVAQGLRVESGRWEHELD